METGLRIKYWWHDIDIVEVWIAASNGEFSGAARAYVDHDALKNAASVLAGFPNSPDDSRELRFGTMDPSFAGGGASLRFFCHGSAGHGVVEVRIVDEADPVSNLWSRPSQAVHLFADVEAAAIDDFVAQMKAFNLDESRIAFLRFNTL